MFAGSFDHGPAALGQVHLLGARVVGVGAPGDVPAFLQLTPYRLRLTDVETLSGRKATAVWP
jgi:hypothetical protein